MNTRIDILNKNPVDDKYCGIVMQWRSRLNDWVHSGISVREDSPEKAFSEALKTAIDWGIWS